VLDADAKREARRLRRVVGRLPIELQRILRRARHPHVMGGIYEFVQARVTEIAILRNGVVRLVDTGAEGVGGYHQRTKGRASFKMVVPAHLEEQILRELAASVTFRRELARTVNETLGSMHRLREVGGSNAFIPATEDVLPAVSGRWLVEADRGFKTATTLGSRPEALNVALARRIHERFAAPFLGEVQLSDEDREVHVLDWFCGPRGAFALVLDAVPHPGVRYVTTEIDVFRDLIQREAACVDDEWPVEFTVDPTGMDVPVVADPTPRHRGVRRLYDVPIEGPRRTWPKFDAIVLDMPAPGEGIGAQLRNAYKENEGPERHLPDPGRYGPRRWKQALQRSLNVLSGLLAPGGEAFVVVPGGVRRGGDYRADLSLFEDVPATITRAGLFIEKTFEMIEKNPVNQAFVAKNRPPMRLYVVHHASGVNP